MELKLLIASDDNSIASLIRETCHGLGVDDLEFVKTKADIEKRLGGPPCDMYVLNQAISGTSGLDLTRLIRETQPNAPVMLITSADSDKAQKLEAIKAGVSDFVKVPIDPSDIETKFKTWFKVLGLDDAIEEDEVVPVSTEKKPELRQPHSCMKIEYINPFVVSVINTFATMFEWPLKRLPPCKPESAHPPYEMTGIVHLTGKVDGMVALSLSREVALAATSHMFGQHISFVNEEVRDAVGELANIVVGGAKARLEDLKLNAELPTVLIGHAHIMEFPDHAVPIMLPFESRMGSLAVIFGMSSKDDA